MRTLIAITRPVSRSIVQCELTHLSRESIDYDRAVEQHDEYEAALAALGCRIERIPPAHDMPDAVFVEDTAVVLDDVAIMTRPGAESRRAELDGVREVLDRYRTLEQIEAPGTLDGGDVLRVGMRFFVGRSSRTNEAGIAQFRALVSGHGCRVDAVQVRGCLHLKSAVTAVGNDVLLGNSAWVDPREFGDVTWIEVDRSEPHAANALWVGDGVIFPAAYPRTAATLADRLRMHGLALHTVNASELAKAEGGLTCCSLILSAAG